MDWDLVKVLNLLGIVLEFASFWFAAPEILGEERLRALEWRIERGVSGLPTLLMLSMVLGAVLVPLALMILKPQPSWSAGDLSYYALGLVMMLSAPLVFDVIQKRIVWPLYRSLLGKGGHVRQRSLAVGAVLFVVGFLCQFMAALLDISAP